MGDFLVTMVLCGVTACVCYIAGKNDALAACQHRDLSGRYELQFITPAGNETEPMRTLIDNHNRILKLVCKRDGN